MKNPPIKKSTQNDYHKTSLRLPKDLYQVLLASAEYHGHTLNAEILTQLRNAPTTELIQHLVRENAEMKSMIRQLLDLASDK